MPSSLFREIATGMVFITCAAMMVVFAISTYRTYLLFRFDKWWKEIEPPLAVTLYVTGATLFNGVLWLALHFYNQDMDAHHVTNAFVVLIILSLLIKMLGGVMMIRQFSLPSWGPWPAVVTVLMSLVMGVYCYWSYVSIWGPESIFK